MRLDTETLTRLGADEEPEGPVMEVVSADNLQSTPTGVKLSRDCPFCKARESLTLIGFQAATLTSLYIDQLFASWRGMPCLRAAGCQGRYDVDPTAARDYFGRLYAGGDLQRIFTEEHTGLLDRVERERVEYEFKARAGDAEGREPWFANLLSCTPTLEMGIVLTARTADALQVVGQKPGYRWTLGDAEWLVEPQVEPQVSESAGVPVSIDFVMRPAKAKSERRLAIFLDGWTYHKDRIGTGRGGAPRGEIDGAGASLCFPDSSAKSGADAGPWQGKCLGGPFRQLTAFSAVPAPARRRMLTPLGASANLRNPWQAARLSRRLTTGP